MIRYLPNTCNQESRFLSLKTAACFVVFFLLSQSFVAAFQAGGKIPLQGYGGERNFVICADGTIWATNGHNGIICFSDGRWETFSLLQSDADVENKRNNVKQPIVDCIIGGSDGMAFVKSATICAVCCSNAKAEKSPSGHVVASGTLHALLEERGDLIRTNFSKPSYSLSQPRVSLAFTKSGQIWCSVKSSVHVFDGEVWHDANDALISVGARRKGMALLSTIGDERVYVSGLRNSKRGRGSFFGELKEGVFQFTAAPNVHDDVNEGYVLYDKENAFWFGSTNARSLSSADQRIKQAAVKIVPNESPEIYEDAGVPRLIDESGSVWLANTDSRKASEFKIQRNGKVVQQCTIPGFQKGRKLFCDKPGSVYAEKRISLQHLVAEGPDFDDFKIADRLRFPEDLKRPKFLGYSSQGGLVYADGMRLHLRKLSGGQE